MSDVLQQDRSKLVPPAAGQFGFSGTSEQGKSRAYHPVGCPSLEQFEARMLSANDSARA